MWPEMAAVPLAAPVVLGDRLKSSEKVWPGEKDARRRFAEGEDEAAGGESSPDMMNSMAGGLERGVSDEGSSNLGTGGLEDLRMPPLRVLTFAEPIRTLWLSFEVLSTAKWVVGSVDPLCQWSFHLLMSDPIEHNRTVNTEKPDERVFKLERASSGFKSTQMNLHLQVGKGMHMRRPSDDDAESGGTTVYQLTAPLLIGCIIVPNRIASVTFGECGVKLPLSPQ